MGNRPVLLIKHPPIASHDSGNGTWIIDGDEKQHQQAKMNLRQLLLLF